ncbi:hypothetical protein N2152v2_009703 [Parachlorella kessleri]
MRLQAVLISWGGSRWLGVPQQRASPQGWHGYRRSGFRPSLAPASAGGSPEQPVPSLLPTGTGQPSGRQRPPDAWEQACQQVAAFQREHGRLPRASADAQGVLLLPGEGALGLWCTEQQQRKAGSTGPPLRAHERAALRAIPGWRWWATKRVIGTWVQVPWEQRRQQVAAYYQQHGRLPRQGARKSIPLLPGEKELGNWVHRQRHCYKSKGGPPLSTERIAALESTPGWAWEDCTPWEQRLQEVQYFVRQQGRFPREKAGKNNPFLPGEKELGYWVNRQRQHYKNAILSPARIAALDASPGWCWDEDDRWEQQRQKLEAFVRVHGRLPRRRPTQKGPLLEGEPELASWLLTQRKREHGTDGLAPLVVAAWEDVGWALGSSMEVHAPSLHRLLRSKRPRLQHGLQRAVLYSVLTSWSGSRCLSVLQQRAGSQGWQAYRRSGFRPPLAAARAGGSPKQPRAPQPASGAQQPSRDAWEQACQQVAAFQRQHGRLPKASPDAQGLPLHPGEGALGLWCTEQQRRKAGSKGPPLTAQERAALRALPGWRWWSSRRVTRTWVKVPWELRRQEVEAFYQQHGRLPRLTAGKGSAFLPGEKTLGKWVHWQRQCYKGKRQQPLSEERIAACEATPGWVWEEHPPWEQRRQEVEAWYQQHGRLPRATVGLASPFLPGEKALGLWVHRQRQHYKVNAQPSLSAERLAALEATPGWAWEDWTPWEQRQQEVQGFVREHGRLPRIRAGTGNPLLLGERELGQWCSTQRRRFKGQKPHPLGAEQQAALVALPGWYWDVEDDRWEHQRQGLEDFVRVHGRLPRGRPTQKEPLLDGERQLAAWRQTQRRRERGLEAPLSAQQQAALKATPLWCGGGGL